MKIQKTFFIAATLLLTTAGCSNNETADNGLNGLTSGDMIVTLEELTSDEEDGVTRSFLNREMQSHLWVEDDMMRVYDPMMIRYDIYKFGYKDESRQMGAFTRIWENSNYSEAPSFVLFADQDVESGYFDRDKETDEPFLACKFMIGADKKGNLTPMSWQSTQNNGKDYYIDWLPRWGQVTEIDGSGVLHTSLKFLTGVLRLQLANTAGKADLLKIQMFKGDEALNIAGTFTAKLSVNGTIVSNPSLTQESFKRKSGGTDLFVDLTGATGSVVVFVPLVTTTVPVDIVVSASSDNGETWTEFKRFKNKTIKRGIVYGNANEYAF